MPIDLKKIQHIESLRQIYLLKHWPHKIKYECNPAAARRVGVQEDHKTSTKHATHCGWIGRYEKNNKLKNILKKVII